MKAISGFLGLVMACAFFAPAGNAALVLSFGPVQTFNADSGIQSIDVFVNSTEALGEFGPTLGVDFILGNGAAFNAPNAGTFGGVGFLGNGNINSLAGASSFDRDTNPGFENTGYLNISFSNLNQQVTSGITPLATLLVDTTGLAVGNYSITTANGFFGLGTIADASSSFNITAVPEPTSMLTAGVGLIGLWYGRRRMKKNIVA